MPALPSMGSERRRAPAAGPPARPPLFRRAAQLPTPTRAEPLEPRVLLATFTVTTTADAGLGSLRQAILDANAAPGPDTVDFSIGAEPAAVVTIRPLTPLPVVTDVVHLDGTTQPGYVEAPLVELDGSAAGMAADGLTFIARGSAVRALAINRFSGHGIALRPLPPRTPGSGSTNIISCHIGTNTAGDAALGNGGAGVYAEGHPAVISSPEVDRPNVISGNALAGVWVVRATGRAGGGISISRSHIGTNRAGTAALGNGGDGVLADTDSQVKLSSASTFEPGAPRPEFGNVISGNGGSGVRIVGSNSQCLLTDNLIGTDVTGARALPNGTNPAAAHRDGVTFTGGGRFVAYYNVVSGNTGAGVSLASGAAAPLLFPQMNSNHIGTDASGLIPVGNGSHGVDADLGASTLDLRSNTISANQGNGVLVRGSSAEVTVSGNYIGSSFRGVALGNGGNGLELRSISRAMVGGPNALDRGTLSDLLEPIPPGTWQNVISANRGHGIVASTEGRSGRGVAMSLTIWSNLVGTDRSGRLALGNGGSGIHLSNVRTVRVGAPDDAPPRTFSDGRVGNVIVNNGGDGITVVGPTFPVPNLRNDVNGNRIGVSYVVGAPQQIVPMPNVGYGVVLLNSSNNRIGRADHSDGGPPGNIIAHNIRGGVLVRSDGAPAEDNLIRRNSIFANGGLGIDLAPSEGVTANDPLDADAGGNGGQNHPVITAVDVFRGTRRVHVTLHSIPMWSFQVDVYSSSAPDRSGYGEGQVWLASGGIATDAQGNGRGIISIPPVPAGRWLTATATTPSFFRGSTSEFSRAVSAVRGRPVYRPEERPPALTLQQNDSAPDDLLH